MLLEEQVGLVLVLGASDHLRSRQEHERSVELRSALGQEQVVEVGERDHEPCLVRADELLQGREVTRTVDERHDRALVRVVERRRKRVGVDGNRARAGTAEGGDDVDPLSGAGEEDGGQGRKR